MHLGAALFTTSLATAALVMANPILGLLTLYDWYLLGAFSFGILNRTVHGMILAQTKYHVVLNKCNFLGFETEKAAAAQIREIKYTGEVKNTYMSFDYAGLPPSIAKVLSVSGTSLKRDPTTGDAASESVPTNDKNTFKHFASFMANDVRYLIPLDNDNFRKSVITEELLNHIIHGRQLRVLNYDYEALERE